MNAKVRHFDIVAYPVSGKKPDIFHWVTKSQALKICQNYLYLKFDIYSHENTSECKGVKDFMAIEFIKNDFKRDYIVR